MNVERRIHKVWQELENAKLSGIPHIMGKYQYVYSKDDLQISLVEFVRDDMYASRNWEIMQIKGGRVLFEDVERYSTKEKAEKRIMELFDDDKIIQ